MDRQTSKSRRAWKRAPRTLHPYTHPPLNHFLAASVLTASGCLFSFLGPRVPSFPSNHLPQGLLSLGYTPGAAAAAQVLWKIWQNSYKQCWAPRSSSHVANYLWGFNTTRASEPKFLYFDIMVEIKLNIAKQKYIPSTNSEQYKWRQLTHSKKRN